MPYDGDDYGWDDFGYDRPAWWPVPAPDDDAWADYEDYEDDEDDDENE
jgi:hypothetical protein